MEGVVKYKRSYRKIEQTNELKDAEIGTFIKDMENGRSCEIQMKLLIYRSDDQAIEDFEN